MPLVLHLRLCRRWSFESPRISHPSAVPIGRSPGCPVLRSFGIADDPLSELPRISHLPAPAGGLPSHPGLHLRLCQRRISGSPRTSYPLATPVVNLPSCPGSSFLWLRRRTQFPGCPESQVLRRCRWTDLRVAPHLMSFGGAVYASPSCPGSASTAGSMMNPRLSSNFASSACAADESSCPAGPASSCLTLDALSISLDFPPSACASRTPQSINPAFPARPELLSNSLQGHQLNRDIRPVRICGSKCKIPHNLWISPFTVHSYWNFEDALRGCRS